jgi:hypothetical protein
VVSSKHPLLLGIILVSSTKSGGVARKFIKHRPAGEFLIAVKPPVMKLFKPFIGENPELN